MLEKKMSYHNSRMKGLNQNRKLKYSNEIQVPKNCA